MFASKNVPVILAKANLVRGQNDDGDSTLEAECQIVLEPFRESLARELGEGIASHLFTDERSPSGEEQIRLELQSVTLNPRVPSQAVSVSKTHDGSYVAGIWRHVSFGALTISCVEKGALVWLKAVQRINFSITPKDHRELLIKTFGEILYLSFEAEQGDMLSRIDPQQLADDMSANLPTGVESVTVSIGGKSATGKAH